MEKYKTTFLTSLVLALLILLGYIYAYIKVLNGTGIDQVKKINLLMIVSTVSLMVVLGLTMYVAHCEQYYWGFSQDFIDEKKNDGIITVS